MEESRTEAMPSTFPYDLLTSDTDLLTSDTDLLTSDTDLLRSDITDDGFSTEIIATYQYEMVDDCPPLFGQLQFPSGSGIDRLASTLPTATVGEKNDVESLEVGALSVFSLVVCVVGLLGNITVIILVLSRKELTKGITIWYILQLAIADMLFLSTIPFQFIEDKYSRWTLSESSCKFKQSIMFINFYSSISFLTVMAIDRYIAVCHSLTEGSQKLRTRKAAYITTAVVWIACISASTPAMTNSVVDPPGSECKLFPRRSGTNEKFCKEQTFISFECCTRILEDLQQNEIGSMPMFDMTESEITDPSDDNNNETIQNGCSYHGHPHEFKVMIITNFVVFLILCFVIIACYALIMRHLWTKAFRVKGASTNNTRNRNRVIYMCVTLVLVFVACWVPYHAQHLAKLKGIMGRRSAYCENITYATSLLLYVNSAVNPFIYFFIARLKSHIKSLKSSRAASVMITLFSRNDNGDRTPITKRSARIETKKNDVKYSEGKFLTELQSNV